MRRKATVLLGMLVTCVALTVGVGPANAQLGYPPGPVIPPGGTVPTTTPRVTTTTVAPTTTTKATTTTVAPTTTTKATTTTVAAAALKKAPVATPVIAGIALTGANIATTLAIALGVIVLGVVLVRGARSRADQA